jgi:hypothetical protein
VKIKYQSFGLVAKKMEPVNANAGFYIKKVFAKGDIVFELKILLEFLRFKYEQVLQEVCKDRKDHDPPGDIKDGADEGKLKVKN